MKHDKNAHRKLERLARQVQSLDLEAQFVGTGRQARVVSRFNGQPYGSSRRPLTGEILRITSVCLDGGRVTLCTDDPRVNAGFGLEDVELLPCD